MITNTCQVDAMLPQQPCCPRPEKTRQSRIQCVKRAGRSRRFQVQCRHLHSFEIHKGGEGEQIVAVLAEH